MAINITDDLAPVRYYTQLDPYFYDVDNRPLTDLDKNMATLTQAIEGSFSGVELSEAVLSRLFTLSTVPTDAYYGRPIEFNNMVGSLPEGFLVFQASYPNFNAAQRPHIALSFTPFSAEFSAPASGKTRVYIVQTKPESVTTESDVPFIGSSASNHYGASSSLVYGLKRTLKYQDFNTGSVGSVSPDSGYTALVQVTVPAGTSSLTEANVEYLRSFKFESELQLNQAVLSELSSVSAKTTLDLTEGRYFDLTLTSSTQLETIRVPKEGATDVVLRITQDGTGERTFAFPEGSIFVSGSEGMVSSAANSETWVRMISYNGGPWRIFSM